MSRTYSLKSTQKIPVSIDHAWNFFSDPRNLGVITPAALDFRIISRHHGETMYPGQLIEYKVRPISGIRVYWMTEITHVSPGKYFIDEQRFGPYSFWHHQHHFEAIAGGVMMTDIVHYRIPFGWLGNLANALFVGKKLDQIFEHRRTAVETKFGKWTKK